MRLSAEAVALRLLFECFQNMHQGEVEGTDRAHNANFRRKLQIFADSTFFLELLHLEGAGSRREPQMFAEGRRSSGE